MTVLLALVLRLLEQAVLLPADLTGVLAVVALLGTAVAVGAVVATLVVLRALPVGVRIVPLAWRERPVAETLPRSATPASRPRPRAPMGIPAVG